MIKAMFFAGGMQFALSLVTALSFSLAQQFPDIYHVGRDVTAPMVMSRVEPQYSEAARAARVQGTVVLEAVISADGVPRVVRVVRSLGYGLDENVIAAFERWRFNPGRKDGVPVNVSLNVEFNFNLAGNRANPNIEALVATRSGMSLQLRDSSAPVAGDVLRAVQAWYVSFQGSAGTRAQYNGYVGGRFDKTYELMSQDFKTKVPQSALEEMYAELAHTKLLQAYLAQIDDNAGTADVFVEEERTVVFSQRVPAVTWYEGTLKLTRDVGEWRIAEIDLRPEDLISVNYGGHQPWRNNPIEVARVAVQPPHNVSPLPESCVTPPTDTASGVADIDVCGDSREVVRVARLHSGEWRVISFVSGLAISRAKDLAAVAQQEFVPKIEFTAEPFTIQQGESTTLRWKVDHANAVSIQPAVGTVDATGSLEVRPSSSITYQIRASGPGGIATSNIRITVTTRK
jgi:TonB family protein